MKNKIKLFEGEGFQPCFARIIYKRLKNRLWVSYAEVMAEYNMEECSADYKVSVRDGYSELKKVFPKVLNAIKEAQGESCIEVEGTNRNRRYRYIGESDEPLADLLHAKVIDDISQYMQFCQDSAGFFPDSWLDYYLKDTQDLLDIRTKKKRGEQIIGTSIDRKLKNIEWLPLLYEAITHKQVLAINYKPYSEGDQSLLFHPHYLKEYNGRWFLFGFADGDEDGYVRNLALDRITDRPREVYKVAYCSAPKGYYDEFFKNIIGVSHYGDKKVWPIVIRAYNRNIFGLIETKKFHVQQETTVPYGQHSNGEYGEFQINVEMNNEIIGSILHYGNDLEVVSPKEVREIFRARIEKLASRYSTIPESSTNNGTSE